MISKIEYRVRPVTRYIVTRYEEGGTSPGSSQHGEYDSWESAYAVGYALCKAEQDSRGWPPGDERMVYPAKVARPEEVSGAVLVIRHHGEWLGTVDLTMAAAGVTFHGGGIES